MQVFLGHQVFRDIVAIECVQNDEVVLIVAHDGSLGKDTSVRLENFYVFAALESKIFFGNPHDDGVDFDDINERLWKKVIQC